MSSLAAAPILGLRESTLLIAENHAAADSFASELESRGFIRAETPEDVFGAITDGKSVYALLTSENEEGMYRLATQYPTGQITFSTPSAQNSRFAEPNYEQAGFALILLRDEIERGESRDLRFREVAGVAIAS